VSGAEAVRAFEQCGWQVARQRGSHVILTQPGMPITLSIPQHRLIGPGLLRDQIGKAGLSVEEFVAALR
jgi:predicted RNA binding protein YcfA (HicA-like mRNA interferase family)